MPNRERLDGPLIEGQRLSKRLIDFLHRIDDGQQSATAAAAQAQDAASAAAPSVSITGPNVTGSAESGYYIAAPSSSSGVPLLIGEDVIYTVAANMQVLYHYPITIDGALVVDGVLLEV